MTNERGKSGAIAQHLSPGGPADQSAGQIIRREICVFIRLMLSPISLQARGVKPRLRDQPFDPVKSPENASDKTLRKAGRGKA